MRESLGIPDGGDAEAACGREDARIRVGRGSVWKAVMDWYMPNGDAVRDPPGERAREHQHGRE